MRDFMAVIKALADENRVRILMALTGRELCVCQIVELLGLATSTVSKHMSVLKQARLVDSRKHGRCVYYRPADREVLPEAAEATALVVKSVANDGQIQEDAERLEQILQIDTEELCRRHSRSKS